MSTKYLKAGRPSRSNKDKLIGMLKGEDEIRSVSLKLPIELHDSLKMYAAKNRETARSVMVRLLEDLLIKENLYSKKYKTSSFDLGGNSITLSLSFMIFSLFYYFK